MKRIIKIWVYFQQDFMSFLIPIHKMTYTPVEKLKIFSLYVKNNKNKLYVFSLGL